MSRPLRIEFAGALYHVTSRGNERKPIFLEDFDRLRFLDLLEDVVDRYSWRVYAYCLMDNHFHLLIETLRPELARGMKRLNSVYAQRFNRRHERSGHLLGDRYHALLVEREEHFLEVARYVVLNPVRAGICERPEEYRWSSYRATSGIEPEPALLAAAELLASFSSVRQQAEAQYRRFCADPIGSGLWQKVRGQIYLGGDRFLDGVKEHVRSVERDEEVPIPQWEPNPRPLSALFAEHGERAVLVAYRQHGYRLRELAKYLGCHSATVSRRLRRLERGD